MLWRKKLYVEWRDYKPRIYTTWKDCKQQVKRFSDAQHKDFKSIEEAKLYLEVRILSLSKTAWDI